MLKTTTETGDIGLFSIRPVRSSITFHGPFRTRPVFGDISFARPCISDGVDTASLGDEGRRLPSYRDTASEIISMCWPTLLFHDKLQLKAFAKLQVDWDDAEPIQRRSVTKTALTFSVSNEAQASRSAALFSSPD
ncbi:hypothetical protein B0T22DRAFT_508562 [Podospora appendiculata]|uniref:Uncharacterized protein n=1 Tax=Podospora appendiculata TaxID=314037 RepID=A0AAE0XL11_9PEZI|nr:hypothetical protein B0T22DRAFT_508562 [Podospora appendiculata]